jgi:hypothetical protein
MKTILARENIFSVAIAGGLGASIGLITPFLYIFFVGLFALFSNSGLDWLKDGLFAAIIGVLLFPAIIGPLAVPASLLVFTTGGIIGSCVGIFVADRLPNHPWLVSITNGIAGLALWLIVVPKGISTFFSTNLLFSYLPAIFLIIWMILIGRFAHKRISVARSAK